MVKDDVVALWGKVHGALLYRLLQNGAHPINLKLGAEGGGNVLKHQAQGVIQPGGGKEKPKKVGEGQHAVQQECRASEHCGGQPDAQKGLGGAHKHPCGQFRADGTPFHRCQFLFQHIQIGLLAAAGLNVPDGFKPFLDAVSYRPLVENAFRAEGILDFLGSRCQ